MAFAQAIVQAYQARAMDPARALEQAQITPTQLRDSDARISSGQLEALSAAAMRELDDEALGWFSRRLPWGSYGMLARASLSAPTLGLALARWCRHHALLTDDILLPMADHIAMALERCRRGIRLPNPLQHDIMVMFPDEYRIAEQGLHAIEREEGLSLPPEEAGYLSLHIHAGISEQNAGDSLTNIRLAADCIAKIETELGISLRRTELKYTRLISHVCYMILRIRAQEEVPLQMDEYVRKMYPRAYQLAEKLCKALEEKLCLPISSAEVTLLAIHIQRVL